MQQDDAMMWEQLWRAVSEGDALELAQLFERYTWSSSTLPGYLLHLAVKRNDADVVALLLEKGNAPVHALDVLEPDTPESNPRWTPLHVAAAGNSIHVMKLLIKYGTEVDVREEYSRHIWTPLMLAANSASVHAVKTLIEDGADMELRDDITGQRALHLAAMTIHGTEAVKELLIRGAQPNAQDALGTAALHYVTEFSAFESVGLLLAYGADINAQDVDGSTPLSFAAQNCTSVLPAVVLIANGADVDTIDSSGMRALHYATMRAGSRMVTTLLRHGASPVIRDNDGLTPLHYCARYGGPNRFRVLLENEEVLLDLAHGANGASALDDAVQFGRVEGIKLMLEELQAVRDRVNPEGVFYQAVAIAVRQKKHAIAKLIAEASTNSLLEVPDDESSALS